VWHKGIRFWIAWPSTNGRRHSSIYRCVPAGLISDQYMLRKFGLGLLNSGLAFSWW
jgi:hypothetical protein